ncbi:beta strand repeat-containing protein [Verrucomicrobiota bacterium sgz303538]
MPRKHNTRPVILAASVLALLAPNVSAAILDQFTFGPDAVPVPGSTAPSILTPTTVAPGISASAISADAGVTLDLSNSQGNPPPSAPWLRVSPVGGNTTPAAAVLANADFKFTLSAIPGFTLNLTSLTFDMMRGGAGTRGYELRSSLDNFGSTISTAAATSQRGGDPAFTNFPTTLTGATYQNLSTITFKIYSYSGAAGASVEYDNITVIGTTTFNGYTWQGGDGKWDTTSSNWTGTGTTYVDNTATSNVWFSDAGTTGAVNVAAGGLSPNLITFTNSATKDYTFSGGSLNVATSLFKSGNGTATLSNNVTAGSVTADTGTLAVGNGGTLTSPNITVSPTGLLTVASGGALGATSGLTVNGPLTLNNATQKVATLNGATTGVVTLNGPDGITGTVLEVTGTSTYAGKISGVGSLVKSADGILTLSGTSDYMGGTTVTGGTLQLNSSLAAGFGDITVKNGGKLSLGTAVSNFVTLSGGTLGVSAAVTLATNLTVTAPSTINTFNPATGATGNDLILNGMLLGSGDINLVSINNNNPDDKAFRLRGTSSDYSGTITVAQSAKLELQTSVDSGSPMGTGKLVVTGGTTSTGANGTFSIINVRNNFGADTTFGNNVEVVGSGASYFNMLGTTASVSKFGDLKIGDGQSIAAVATTGASGFTLAFSSVHLTGGNATFTPQPVGNTNYKAVENISLSTITENVPNSGITMNGAATLTLTGNNTYTGATTVNSGTLVVDGSISGSTVSLNGGTLKGIGTTGALNVFGGILAPGNGPGTLNTGTLTFNGGALALEIGGSTAGSYDQLNVVGGLAFNAPVTLTLDFGTYDPVDGVDRFVIVNNDLTDAVTFGASDSRLFFGSTQLNEGTIFTATSGSITQAFQITYAGGTNNNDIVLTAVPEPGSTTALLIGLGMLASSRRRRR